MKCPGCNAELKPSGMCCDSGEDSGYQCWCDNCKTMWIDTFDGRILVDELLTTVLSAREVKVQP